MKTVSARDANQRFSRLLAEAAAGEEIVITRRGKPVVRLVPVGEAAMRRERMAAIDRMVRAMKRGVHLGRHGFTRDEMHER